MVASVTAEHGDLLLGLGTYRSRTFVAPAGQSPVVTNVATGSVGRRSCRLRRPARHVASGSSKVCVEDRRTAGWDTGVNRSMLSGIQWSSFRVVG